MLVQIITENGQKKIKPLTADAGAGAPVGTVIAMYKKSNPSGFLYLDGRDTTGTSEELSTHYPLLYAYLGSNVLPDYREFALVGAEENTTDVYNASTNPTGTIHDHDVYTEGQAKDDQLQSHVHNGMYNNYPNGVFTMSSGNNGTALTGNVSNARSGTVTRGKRKAVYFYIKATSGLSENAQDNVINTLNEERSYSTSEVNTGKKWIDGKPIYRKVVDCGNLPNATSKTVNHNISNFGELVTMFARAYSNNTYLPIPYGSTGDPAIIFITKTGVILSTTSNLSSWTDIKVILEYTKTT